MSNREFAELIANIMLEKNLRDVTIVDVKEKSTITDFLVIATARNPQMAKSSAEFVEEKLAQQEINADGKDGIRDGKWIVIDYSEVMVHIFTADMRSFYNIEKLWAEPENSNITIIAPKD